MPLGAQTFSEALARIPSDARSLEVYRNAPGLDERMARALGPGAGDAAVVDIYGRLVLEAPARSAGTVVVAEFPAEPGKKGTRSVTWLPARDFKALTRALGAAPAKDLFKAKRKNAIYYFLRQGRFALVATDPALLRRTASATAFLAPALTAAAPWVETHDFAILAAPSSMAQGLKGFRKGFEAGAAANAPAKAAAVKTLFGPLVDQIEASAALAGVAVDLPQEGGIRAEGRVFFKAGSPLAGLAETLPASPGHPLEGLSPAGMVMGFGGIVPPAFADLANQMATANLSPEEAAKAAPLLEAAARNQEAMGFILGLPSGPGAPLLEGIRWFLRVKDVPEYFRLLEAQRRTQATALATLGLKADLARDVLPGTPSCTFTFTLDAARPGPLPLAQAKVFLTLLTGTPDRFQVSAAKADDHTILGVFGDAKALETALAGFGPGFAADPGVAAVDALLPAGAPWRFYLDPVNARTLAQDLMTAFAPQGGKPLPPMPPVPPLGMALTVDAGGASLTGAATPQSLQAVVAFFQAVKPARTAAPAAKGK